MTIFPTLFSKVLTHTMDWIENSRALTRLLKPFSWLAWLVQVEVVITGGRRYNVVRSFVPWKSSAGDEPVMECGVFWYAKRKRRSLSWASPDFIALKVRTKRSASPLDRVVDWGKYTTYMVELHKCFEFIWNKLSTIVETICSGMPIFENYSTSLLITVVEVVLEFIQMTSGHFVWASTTMSQLQFRKGPCVVVAKPSSGIAKGAKENSGGFEACCWHDK